MVQGQQRACMPVQLYILEKVDIWSGVTDALHHSQTTEYSATQLVSSIKFKLSHAIRECMLRYPGEREM